MHPLLPALPWVLPYGVLAGMASRHPALRDFPAAAGRPLSVIIPARNEAEVIERCVRSVLASHYAPLEVLVVDDRSTDDTAAIVRRLAAEDARVRLVEGRELPAGWFGKPWACVQGAEAATGELLCFTDADTIHDPDLLPRAVGGLEATGAELFTILPQQLCLTAAEKLVLPQIFFILGARFTPRRVNRARHASAVIANGQFILMPRTAYARVGTHAAVKHEVAEDLALGQEVYRRGGKVFLAYATDLMRTRMYTSWAHLREGWSKNLYLGARRSLPGRPLLQRLVPSLLAFPFLFWVLPPVALLLALAGPLAAYTGAAALATGLSLGFWMLVHFGMEVPLRWAFGYPAGAVAAAYIAIRSTIRGARRVEWKGRVYRAGDATRPA